MIRDVMVWLDGGVSDEIRLAASAEMARRLDTRMVIGLYLNAMPLPSAVATAEFATELIDRARATGDKTEALLAKRLQLLERAVEIRRFDVLADDIANIAAREARAADTFVALRPNGVMDPTRLVEGVLFGSGHHLFLVPEIARPRIAFDRIMIAWNGSRESARALSESLPFLHIAHEVVVAVVTSDRPSEEEAIVGVDAVNHLRNHDVRAVLCRLTGLPGEVGGLIIDEAERRKTDLIVMGGYGHGPLRERLLGGVTHELMHESPIPLLMAH
jgi:nucleotide-binding universal stress UspA family protein